MEADWIPLRKALGDLRADRMRLPVWWRDDDAVEPSRALDTLENLSATTGLPVHIAVIPGRAQPTLAQRVTGTHNLIPVVHGWRHENHAPEAAKKAEFGHPRAAVPVELERAFTHMRSLFGTAYLPLFVPPWNRVDTAFFPEMVRVGYRGVSTFLGRKSLLAAPGLVQINTHIDPIDWRGSRSLVTPQHLIEKTVEILQARLGAEADATEPLGYLTHHLVHTSEVWEFSERFLNELLAGGAEIQPIAPLLENTT